IVIGTIATKPTHISKTLTLPTWDMIICKSTSTVATTTQNRFDRLLRYPMSGSLGKLSSLTTPIVSKRVLIVEKSACRTSWIDGNSLLLGTKGKKVTATMFTTPTMVHMKSPAAKGKADLSRY